jgi:sulfur transfer complex TusBCD TusB component (DsrH family)
VIPSRCLSVIETAYRATAGGTADIALRFTHALRGAGAEVSILLKGEAVSYSRPGHAVPLSMDKHLEALIDAGVSVYVLAEDVAERGLCASVLVPGVRPVSRGDMPRLLAAFDRVLYW